MRTVDILARLGAEPRRIDRDPGYPFASGSWHATCPRCDRFAAITVDRTGSWQAACGCWGRPWSRHDELDLMLALAA
ncbi:MAG: hypothetical protein WEG56_06930 [Chloroflexota bacterium]